MPIPKLKYEQFCQSYLETGNAAAAAREAGYAEDYAAQQGHRLLRRPAVAARLAELRAEIAARDCLNPDALLVKLEAAYRSALENDKPAIAARVVADQAKLAAQYARLSGGGEGGLAPGAEPTRAALSRIARQLGVSGPHDAPAKA